MAIGLAGQQALSGVPIVVVSAKDSVARGLKSRVGNLVLTTPSDMITAVKSALAEKA
jgi:hypothetical protein